MGLLPERCLNGKGLLVSDGFQWINLQSVIKTRTVYTVDLSLAGEGDLRGKLKVDRSGYNSIDARKSYLSKGEGGYVKDFRNRSWELSKSEFTNVNEIQLPFKETHEIAINEHATTGGGILYLNPFVLTRQQENPFKKEKEIIPLILATRLKRCTWQKFSFLMVTPSTSCQRSKYLHFLKIQQNIPTTLPRLVIQ